MRFVGQVPYDFLSIVAMSMQLLLITKFGFQHQVLLEFYSGPLLSE